MTGETIECTGCGATIGALEVFPGEVCVTCYAKTPEGRRVPAADEIRSMWGIQPRTRRRA